MITFTPITQEEVGTAGNEFFKPELAAERLGGQGRWFGWGAETCTCRIQCANLYSRPGF